ncbi:MAG: hypothetical protein Q8L88_04945 [Bacteroidota bacterium]|nr:hypothetical protein [Bacteroidota bacterium]
MSDVVHLTSAMADCHSRPEGIPSGNALIGNPVKRIFQSYFSFRVPKECLRQKKSNKRNLGEIYRSR